MAVTVGTATPVREALQLAEDEANQFLLLREKAAHIVKAARSATLANLLAPLLCMVVRLGLGLSIVQRLCVLIGADIQVHSQEGQGATFTVNTPFALAANEDDLPNLPSHPKASPAHRRLQGKYIALIEDNPVIVERYRQTLANKGAHVLVLSEDESELTAQLETIDRIDCILSDYRLSHTTGDALIQELRDSYNLEIPALIVTADTSPSHIHLFGKLNIEVLHKPISFQDIALAIERTLEAV